MFDKVIEWIMVYIWLALEIKETGKQAKQFN